MPTSRRLVLMTRSLETLIMATRNAKRHRDRLLNDYPAMLAAAEEEHAALKDERDETLVRFNAQRVLAGLPELTLQDFKDL